jgi:hypothetical protein
MRGTLGFREVMRGMTYISLRPDGARVTIAGNTDEIGTSEDRAVPYLWTLESREMHPFRRDGEV